MFGAREPFIMHLGEQQTSLIAKNITQSELLSIHCEPKQMIAS